MDATQLEGQDTHLEGDATDLEEDSTRLEADPTHSEGNATHSEEDRSSLARGVVRYCCDLAVKAKAWVASFFAKG